MTDKNDHNTEHIFFPCPCCGELTRSEKDYGTFEICDICGWEDDNVQAEDPDYEGGANRTSLNQARKNYIETRYAKPESKHLNELLQRISEMSKAHSDDIDNARTATI